jgi:hypothetical protein
LDNKSKRCVLLGVSEESKAYKLYDPVDKKIIISRDVVFEESKSWEWGKSQNKSNKVNHNGLADELSDTEEMINDGGDAAELLNTEEINNDAAELLDNDATAIVDNTTSESEEEETPVRQARIRKTPAKFNDYVTGRAAEEEIDLHNLAVYNNSQDPSTYEEAMKMKVWREAMKAEIEAIQKNDTWELTVLPAGCKSIGVKWVYKTKYNEKGDIDKYKARLVAKGYTQRHGIDFNEVFTLLRLTLKGVNN